MLSYKVQCSAFFKVAFGFGDGNFAGGILMSRYTLLLAIIYLGFISLGLPDGTFGVAWPQIYQQIGAPIGMAGTIMVVGTSLAAISGFSSGRVIARFKVGPVVAASGLLTASGLLILAGAQNLAWLFVAAVPLGCGAGAVDAALNGYVAHHYTGRHMNWLHACWGIGATCGPLTMSFAIGHGAGWRAGYVVLGSVQLCLALVFLLSLRLWHKVPEQATGRSGSNETSLPAKHPEDSDRAIHRVDTASGPGRPGRKGGATANSPAGWLSLLIFILYTAVETSVGLWAATILVVSRGFSQETAGLCAAAYYGAITAGRILVGLIVERWGNRELITTGTLISLLSAGLFIVADTPVFAGVALVLLGLGFAPIYPCMMHEVPQRFAPEAVQTVIGRQSGAAALGSAAFPALAGLLAAGSLEAISWAVPVGVAALLAVTTRLNRLT